MRISIISLLVLTVLSLCLLAAAGEPETITGTVVKAVNGVADSSAVFGHRGVLRINSTTRWSQLSGFTRYSHLASLAPIDFAKQNIVLLYKDDCRPAENFSLVKSNLAVTRPSLDFLFRWDPNLEKHLEERSTKFIFAIIPASPSVQVTL